MGRPAPTGSSPALSSASVSEAEQPWRRAPRVQGQPRTMRPEEKLSNLMGLHDFSAITALILAPAHAAKSSSLNGAVTSLVRCSKVASKHARGRVKACETAMRLLSDLMSVCLMFLYVPAGHHALLLCTFRGQTLMQKLFG